MNYQPTHNRISWHGLPGRGAGLGGLFWAAPEPPAFYAQPGAWLLLCSNHRSDLVRWGEVLQAVGGGGIYAVDSGGLSIGVSLALRSVGRIGRARLLNDLSTLSGGGELFVQASLAGQLGLGEGASIGEWRIHLIPDQPAQGEQVIRSSLEKKSVDQASTVKTAIYRPRRLGNPVFALRLWFGQALLFALPLIVMGLPVFLAGEILLFTSALLLALLWQSTAMMGLLKGAVLGLGLTGAAVWIGTTQGFLPLSIGYIAVAAFLSALWMSVIYSGARNAS